jgi:capsular exopolysaccharide synthesis family protein
MKSTHGKENFGARWQKMVAVSLSFLRHLKLMYLLLILGLAGGLLFYVYTRSIYYTRALVKVHTLGLPIKSMEEYEAHMKHFGQDFLHRAVQEHSATRLGLTEGYTKYETLTDQYLQKVRVSGFDSGTMILETWSYYPSFAAIWPRAVVDGYNDYVKQVREGRRKLLNTVFTEEVENLKKLSNSQAQNAFSFSQSHNAVELFIEKRELDQLPADILRIRELLKARATVEKALGNTALNAEERLSVLSRFEEEYPAIGTMVNSAPGIAPPSLSGRASPAPEPPSTSQRSPTLVVVPSLVDRSDNWRGILAQQRELTLKRNALLERFLPGHPQVAALDREVHALEGRLEGELTILQNRFTLETQRLKTQEQDLVAQLPELARFQREFDTFERERDLFLAGNLPAHEGAMELQKRIGEAAYTMNQDRFSVEYLETVESRLVDPVSPSKKQGLIASLAFGLCMAIGIPVLMERVRSWSSRVDELEQVTGLPALGVVTEDDSLDSLAEEHRGSEAFRIVRAGILFGTSGPRDAKVIMVTSSRPREGKTTISIRLALAMAQAGAKTVLIDGDLRRGRIHRSFGMGRSPGLSEHLSQNDGIANLDDILLTANEVPNLNIITTGETRSDAPELLETNRAAALIEKLKERFDHIIIDSPPVLGLADCYPLQRLSEGIVFVIRSNYSTYNESSSSVQALAAAGAKFFGFVLNRVDLKAPDNYYYYYRYQPKYYASYDYGPSKDGKHKSPKSNSHSSPSQPVRGTSVFLPTELHLGRSSKGGRSGGREADIERSVRDTDRKA